MSLTEHRLFRVPRCRDCSRVRDLGVPQPWFEVDTVSETSSFLPRHLVDADQKCTCDSACDSADHARKGSFIPVSSLDVKHSEGGA